MKMNDRPKELPIPSASKLDREIGDVASRLSSGTATQSDIANMNRLIRQRADSLVPRELREQTPKQPANVKGR